MQLEHQANILNKIAVYFLRPNNPFLVIILFMKNE